MKITLNRGVDKRPGHGPVKIVFTTRIAPPTVAEILAAAVAESQCKAIDKDYFRGGFSSHPRHARR